MSELMTAAGQLAPFLSAAAASMGTAVLVTARDRLAESVVQGGRTFLDAVLRREGEQGGDGDDRGASAVLARLSGAELEVLEAAVGHWLAGDDLSASALEGWVAKAAALRPGGDIHVTATGSHAVAVGRVQGDFNLSYPHPRETDRTDQQSGR
ncbi:hypothetical protein [Streptomyces tauricus]|uniref:hypothetical protein n=1 Tax=Streptomyces tauricus TaxID=68274 RepID=UPI0022439335|nr:hypothetical protein [Streptomyces tauricus]MCW8097750.1 hypothetical protein [Streptomyces tauricus]